jgi:hypothetical protein
VDDVLSDRLRAFDSETTSMTGVPPRSTRRRRMWMIGNGRKTGRPVVRWSISAVCLFLLVARFDCAAMAADAPAVTLSTYERQIADVAGRRGDRDFLMVDKAEGVVILFQNAQPVFSAPALSGESIADQLPPNASSLTFAKLNELGLKVTPAGRYTVTPDVDVDFGPEFRINEVHGPDWILSIHRVYVGAPSQSRTERLKSPQRTDRHITHGAIDVTKETIGFLAAKLPTNGVVPLYILPHDRARTAEYFAQAAAGSPSATVAQPKQAAGTTQNTSSAAELSTQERHVGLIAANRGDRNYLMVDKARGKIFLFENGLPVFSDAALTGESAGDRIPPSALKKTFSKVGTADDKVTPAGRFTLKRDYDPDYGTLLELNEIKGPDWSIAIHRVYLGVPSERRAHRLQSKGGADKNITHGCINVTQDTISYLLRRLPKKPVTALYVLPRDEGKTEDFFVRRS